jgi:signal transduction histidine kinase
MWMFPKSDLKFRLTLRVMAVSAFCFAAIAAYFLVDTDRSMRAGVEKIADITARTLELQQNQIQWMNNARLGFPDLDTIAASVMTPGLCIAYRGNNGETLQRLCGGARSEFEPPKAFAVLYRHLFDPGREVVRPVTFRGAKVGEAVVWIDEAALTADAWRDAGRLIAVLGLTLPLLCALIYAALARALRPTRSIRLGLERIAANDLSTRLPPFDLAELSAIRDVFNHLAERLGTTLAERNELTRRLIALQDDERRHLARELHDEFGQSLAAIRALAASIRQSAAQDCPALLTECDSIARTATHMMDTLRGALFRLRPPDVEELGLTASLQGLVAGWNSRCGGRTRFDIELSQGLESLPTSLCDSLYRIAQEALTNAAKHAEATRVRLRLALREPQPASGEGVAGDIELSVKDDGRASDHVVKSGMGLLGIRERVESLGGRLGFEAGRERGATLLVVIPLAHAQSVAPSQMECPA